MNKRLIYYVLSTIIVMLTIFLKSVIFPLFSSTYFMPDFSLIAIIYFSINYGKSIGQVMGFSTGIVIDALSGAPFGLNALVRVIMGFLLGFFQGKIFLDKFILPSIIITICSIIKYLLYMLVAIIYPIELNINIFNLMILSELGINLLLTPFIFILFSYIGKKLEIGKDSI